jgi:hypothetical protein
MLSVIMLSVEAKVQCPENPPSPPELFALNSFSSSLTLCTGKLERLP